MPGTALWQDISVYRCLASGKQHLAEAMSPMVVRGLASSAASAGLHCRPSVIAVRACSSACRQLISVLSPFDCMHQKDTFSTHEMKITVHARMNESF